MSAITPNIPHPTSQRFQETCKLFSSIGDFKAVAKLQQVLTTMDKDEVYEHAMWAIHELTAQRAGPEAEQQFAAFFEAYFDGAKSNLTPKQQDHIQLLYAERTGVNKDYPEGIQKAYQENLQAFLGDADQIDGVDSLQKAHDVAFALFADKRSIDCPQAKHLSHLIKDAQEDRDLDLIQLVMRQLRTCQEDQFSKKGFLDRTVIVLSPNGEKAESKGNQQKIFIGGAERSLAEYQEGTSDGRYLGVNPSHSGLVVHFNKQAATYWAQECALKHYGTPGVYVTHISMDQIHRESDGHQYIHRIFQESFVGLHLDQIEPLDKYVFDLMDKEDLVALYPNAVLKDRERLEELLFKKDPLQPQLPPLEDPSWTKSEKVKKVAHALIVIISGVFLFKYAVKPLYLKVKEWWQAKPAPKFTRVH